MKEKVDKFFDDLLLITADERRTRVLEDKAMVERIVLVELERLPS